MKNIIVREMNYIRQNKKMILVVATATAVIVNQAVSIGKAMQFIDEHGLLNEYLDTK